MSGRSPPVGDERAAAVQVGAVILLGFVVISLTLYQITVVPAQNAEVEFNHNQRVQEDLQEVAATVVGVAGGGAGGAVPVEMGTTYPARTVFRNPSPATGTLRTAGTTNGSVAVRVANATAIDPEAADFWNGTTRTYATGRLVYEPSYAQYDRAPTVVYENTLTYSRVDGDALVRSQQRLVSGTSIELVLLNGSLARTQASTLPVDVRPLSASGKRIAVTNGSGPVTLRVPTTLDEEAWTQALRPEYERNGGHVVDQRYRERAGGPNLLVVELESNVTYDLRMAKVGVGSGTAGDDRRYIVARDEGSAVREKGGERTLTVAVRDGLNNPVSGETVAANASSGNVTVLDDVSGSDGELRLRYEADFDVDGSTGFTDTVNVSLVGPPGAGFDAGAPENVSLSVGVTNTDGSGLGGGGGGGGPGAGINPNSSDAVVLRSAEIDCNTGNGNGNDCGQVEVTFEALGSTTRNMTQARFNFYNIDKQSQTTRQPPERVRIDHPDIAPTGFSSAVAGGQLKEFADGDPGKVVVDPAAGPETLSLTFQRNDQSNTEVDVDEGDFFVLTILYEDGRSATYFIAPRGS